MGYVDFEVRDATLRLFRDGLTILKKDGEEAVTFPCGIDDIRNILRGGSYQINDRGAFLLMRLTPEGVWVLFERRSVGLNSSCLLAKPLLENALEILTTEA